MNNRKPNWKKWNLIEDAEVWKVIALSLDIDPDKIKRNRSDWMSGGEYVNHEGNEFKDRLDVIKANYTKIDSSPKAVNMNGIAYCHINISKFTNWAINVDWEIPPEMKKASQKDVPINATITSETGNYSSELLNILDLAIVNFYESRREVDPKKEEVLEWLATKAKELKVNLSDNIAEAIFTIIKPDDHNPKIKRVQPQ